MPVSFTRAQYGDPGNSGQYLRKLRELAELIQLSETASPHETSVSDTAEEPNSEGGSDEDEATSASDTDSTEVCLEARVQMLLDLVPTLEATLEHSERLQEKSSYRSHEPLHASLPAQVYSSLVRDRFPKADGSLVECMGEANWERHQELRDMMDHSIGLSQEEPAYGPEDTVVGSNLQSQSLFHDSGLGTTVTPKSRSRRSIVSHSSYISTLSDNVKSFARVPPTPSELARGEPFRCFLCGEMQFGVKDRVGWK